MSRTEAPRKILVAVAWPYASGLRHIGHVAGFGVPSDTFARYHRLRGNDVLMVSGTDEHGTPVMVAADAAGESPRETAERFSAVIREDLRDLGLSYDLFTRTTTANHYRVTQDLFRTLHEKGYVVEQETLGAFSAATGHTLPDRYIEGTCPICGFESARGDQCDNCGNQLDPIDLVDPRSRIDGTPPVFKTTKHLFLDLPAFKEPLTTWIESQSHWRQNVRRFSLNFVAKLKPRPITRDLDWGVPIPVAGYEDLPDKKIYVWFDAVIGYLSASIEWAANRGTPDAWREWWQNPEAEHAYFMGKDNIVFHTVIWPSMLLGYGDDGVYGAGRGDLELPDNVVSSEFLTMEGKKFSSSRGLEILVRDFLSRYDPDALRYFISIAGPETQDTDFTWSEFVRRNNDELVATWGNLVNRTLQSAYKNFGVVPDPGPLTDEDDCAPRTDRRRLRLDRRPDRGRPLQERAAGSDAARQPRKSVHRRAGPVVASRNGTRASRDGPLRCPAGDRQPQDPARAVPAVLLATSPRAARLRRRARRSARVSDYRGGRRKGARRPHRRLRKLGRPLGAEHLARRSEACGSRGPCS